MQQHIRKTCRAAAFGISKIENTQISNRQSTEKLIHAFVTSHLDYCNSLYSGLPTALAPLQHVLNTAARLSTVVYGGDMALPRLKLLSKIVRKSLHCYFTFSSLLLSSLFLRVV